MAQVFTVRLTKDDVTPFLTKLPNDIDRVLARASYKVAKVAQKELRAELKYQNLMDTHTLFDSIQARRRNKSRSDVSMRLYGLGLDHAAPHWVSMKKGRRIVGWAQRKLGQVPPGIYVRPHPWINPALMRAETQTLRVLTEELDKVIR